MSTSDYRAIERPRHGREVEIPALQLDDKGDMLAGVEVLLQAVPATHRREPRGMTEGFVSNRTEYRSEPSRTWLKTKNPVSEAVRRAREESVTTLAVLEHSLA
jgi:hypothetical protein